MASNFQTSVQKKSIKKRFQFLEDNNRLFSTKDLFILVCGFILSRGHFTSYLMPFGYSLYCYILYYDKRKWWLGCSLILGIFTTGEYGALIKNLLVYGLMTAAYFKLYKYITRKWQFAVLMSFSIIIIGLLMNLFQSNYLFDIVLVFLESLLSLSLFYIYSVAISLFINRYRKIYSNQEIVCLGIFVSVLILGLNNIEYFGISISTVLTVFLILLFSLRIGVSVSAPLGMILGLVQNLSTNSNPLLIVIYGLCGIVSGVFREGGKLMVIIGFIISNAMMAFYLNGSTEVFVHLEEIIIASVIILIIPNALWDKIHFFNFDQVNESYQSFCKERINEDLRVKLNKYSILLKQMGTSFFNPEYENMESYHKAFDKITECVCKECYLAQRCWKTDGENTYKIFLEVVRILEQESVDQSPAVFEELSTICINDEALIEQFKFQVQFIKAEKEMMNRIGQNNLFVSNQLEFAGELIQDMKNNLNDKWLIKSDEERNVLVELDKNDIIVEKLYVIQEANERYKVTIASNKRLQEVISKEKIPRMLSDVLDVKMSLDNEMFSSEYGGHLYIYRELSQYRISTGLVSHSSVAGEKSGDIFSDKILDNGNRVLALCDGMGIGDNAYEESDTTMNLLEKFMEAGIDKTVMIKNINSILMLRNEKETFSTLDYVVFDTFTAVAEFNKIGGAITLIVQNGKVKLLRGQSLPVGILNEITIESITLNLNEGDLIVMMTDGIFEYSHNIQEVENWITNAVKNISSNNPQKIADKIFAQFKAVCPNPKDDITILVGRVWKV